MALIRHELVAEDREAIAALLSATGFFSPEEVAIALELVDDRLRLGSQSHYRFLVAGEGGAVLGFACWGPIPATLDAVDLYWIAVHPRVQGQGLGRTLLANAEREMTTQGRHRVYVETSTRPQYAPTRAFYLACGYELVALLPDYYAPGDGKAIFCKVLAG
ncbi:MAG: GNAT family N-acetyltransferase [Thermoanaerobaculum sp.]